MKREESLNTDEGSSQIDSISEAEIIDFSANLVSCLEEKKKLYNKENKASLEIKQLKEVYERGVSNSENNLNLEGLARVNMFLRQEAFNKENPSDKSSLAVDSLVFEQDENLDTLEFDISEDWRPSKEDYELAKADQEKFNLNLKISSFEQLYLEEYKPLDFNWE